MRKGNIIYHVINAAIFIILEIAALNMLCNNGKLQGIWISRGSRAVASTLWGGAQSIKDYFSLRTANDELARENFLLYLKLAQYEAIETESDSTAMDCIAGDFRYTHAEISKISNNSQHNYIIINKGSDDGITEGSGVITRKGAVGVIDAVSRRFSYARSFKNHEMSISARLGREGAVGPLCWDGINNNGAILKEIPHHVEFNPGDTVFTSGFSSLFPADIPLGTVAESRIVNGSTYEISIHLHEDFGSLRYVTIVENMGKDEMKELEDRQ